MPMTRRKSNDIVKINIHPVFKQWMKVESARRGKSMLEFSEMFAKENMEQREDKSHGFKIKF